MNINNMCIFVLLFLSGCAGFYSKPEQSPSLQRINITKLNVFIEMSFTHRDMNHVVDEIEIATNASLNERVNALKDSIINSLKAESSEKRINFLKNTDDVKSGCILKIKIDETLGPKKMLPTILTLGLWPYIDTREVSVKSILLRDAKLVSESNSSHKFKVIASLFLIPLTPFKTIPGVERKVWEDAYRENLSKVEFNKCE